MGTSSGITVGERLSLGEWDGIVVMMGDGEAEDTSPSLPHAASTSARITISIAAYIIFFKLHHPPVFLMLLLCPP